MRVVAYLGKRGEQKPITQSRSSSCPYPCQCMYLPSIWPSTASGIAITTDPLRTRLLPFGDSGHVPSGLIRPIAVLVICQQAQGKQPSIDLCLISFLFARGKDISNTCPSLHNGTGDKMAPRKLHSAQSRDRGWACQQRITTLVASRAAGAKLFVP